jgi:hypothetical protein
MMEDEGSDDFDNLLSAFASISTEDHESLIRKFSQILGVTCESAVFFLEASSWNVELALNNFFSTVESSEALFQQSAGALPTAQCSAELSACLSQLSQAVFAPSEFINLPCRFRNNGTPSWPADTRLQHVEGASMDAALSTPVGPCGSGEERTVPLGLTAPSQPGVYMGSWRLLSSAGFISEAIWAQITVGDGAKEMVDDMAF